MQLTKHTDFAFRALIYLATIEGELTTIKALTDRFSISQSHCMKIINKMSRIGWVKSVRGKNGGITLGCDPQTIVLADVVKVMETTLEQVNCSDPPCLILNACLLRPILSGAQQAYFDYLAQYTLKDLMNEQTKQRLSETAKSA